MEFTTNAGQENREQFMKTWGACFPEYKHFVHETLQTQF